MFRAGRDFPPGGVEFQGCIGDDRSPPLPGSKLGGEDQRLESEAAETRSHGGMLLGNISPQLFPVQGVGPTPTAWYPSDQGIGDPEDQLSMKPFTAK